MDSIFFWNFLLGLGQLFLPIRCGVLIALTNSVEFRLEKDLKTIVFRVMNLTELDFLISQVWHKMDVKWILIFFFNSAKFAIEWFFHTKSRMKFWKFRFLSKTKTNLMKAQRRGFIITIHGGFLSRKFHNSIHMSLD